MRNGSYSFPLFLGLSFVALQFTLANRPASLGRVQMLAAMMVFIVGRWLVFPGEAERTVTALYVLVLLVLLIEAQQLYAANATRVRRADET